MEFEIARLEDFEQLDNIFLKDLEIICKSLPDNTLLFRICKNSLNSTMI